MITNKLATSLLSKRVGPDLLAVQKRHSLYNKYKHGPQKITNPDFPTWQIFKRFWTKEGMQECWHFFKQASTEGLKRKYQALPFPEELNKFEEFDSEEAIKRWKPVADRDSLNGYSEARLIRSPAGHALFTGILDTRIPDDGMTQNSGFVAIIGPTAPLKYPFQMETTWNWRYYNCFEIKFRGDGRKYHVVINTASYLSDIEGYDCFSYYLHTRGGPYWQTIRIPFHKFVFNYKNLIQDHNCPLKTERVKFVAITLQDNIAGPFALEIDHIGLIHQNTVFDVGTAYEHYTFEHIKYKSLSVDCPVPER